MLVGVSQYLCFEMDFIWAHGGFCGQSDGISSLVYVGIIRVYSYVHPYI